MCMKTYDYKDEQKDVKGKVSMAYGHLSATLGAVFICAVVVGCSDLTFSDLRYVQTERLNSIQELQTMLSD